LWFTEYATSKIGRAILPPAAAIGSVNTAGAGPEIAQNTWIEIKGSNLVPATTPADGVIWSTAPSFASGRLPTQLEGISVTINGKPAYVYFYCSAATSPVCTRDQINVLTPLDDTLGPVSLVVTSAVRGGTASTKPFVATMKAVVPSFLRFNPGSYVVATHTDNALLGPTTLYPGLSTPARPGEVVVLYGVGFGLPTATLTAGSSTQSGTLPTLPQCSVGAILTDPLAFAGLISPGLYQFNLTVPEVSANGDKQILCTYNGVQTPVGGLIAVQR
jgi:uncharacterized protein (TIGR03437 family)